METFIAVADFVVAVFAFLAAYFWFRSTQVRLPSPPQSRSTIEADIFQKLWEALNKEVDANKWAAIFAGLSAFTQGVKWLLQTFATS